VDNAKLNPIDRIRMGAVENVLNKKWEPGQELGTYKLIEARGRRGGGQVFLAEHTKIGRRVLLNIVPSRFDRRAIGKFFQEARAVNQMDHENIIQITDFVEDAGSASYYVMEALEGETLAELIGRGGPLTTERALQIGAQICDALFAVHDVGMVHRDLKPESIFVTKRADGSDLVKLTDFGGALLSDVKDDDFGANSGSFLGTPRYMSPEQVRGGDVDRRADLYATGLVLFEMLTGHPPFDGMSYTELANQHLSSPPPFLRSLERLEPLVPQELEDLVQECLSKKPEDRPRSAAEVAERLRAILTALTAPPPSRASSRVPLLLGALLVVSLIGVVALLARGPSGDPQAGADGAVVGVAGGASGAIAHQSEDGGFEDEELIEIAFDSRPSGAEVYRAVDGLLLGATPFTMSTPPSEEVMVFALRLEGFQPVNLEISLEAASNQVITLAKVSEPPAKRVVRIGKHKGKGKGKGKPKPKPKDKFGTINPFAND
jgi:serine/threonine-protein kinase